MSFIGASDDFDLDDDGILRDSMNGTDLLIDDDGILRDDTFDVYKHVVRAQWTDSGFSGDKQSTTSTVQHLQNSFEDLTPIGDESINISELEASKDDMSFDGQENNLDEIVFKQNQNLASLCLLNSLESPLDKPLNDDEHYRKQNKKRSGSENDNNNKQKTQKNELFPPEYYKQLRELGVLVDGVDLSRDSMDEFEELDSKNEDKENMEHDDLIAEYLASEYRREEEEESNKKGKESRKLKSSTQQAKHFEAHFRPSSTQTISSRSFPDYDYDNLSQNLGSQGQSQKTQGEEEEEEISNITNRIIPSLLTDSMNMHGDNANSAYSGATGTALNGHKYSEDDHKYLNPELTHQLSRPSSATSLFSTASDKVLARQRSAEDAAIQRIFRARSQEELPQKVDDRTQQKHLLPTMSSSEPSHCFKLKSKSVSNIANKLGPVKPTHMTVSEISQLTDVENQPMFPWENQSVASKSMSLGSESAGELSTRLTQEAQKRKQATELVQQLQKDYDNLLTKYALAELTIDQMRLGAKIFVHVDSPTPLQAQTGVMSPIPAGQSAQVVALRHAPSQSAKVANVGHAGPMRADANDQTDGRLSYDDQRSRSRPDLLKGSLISAHHQSAAAQEEDTNQNIPEIVTESVKADMFKQARDMEERLESFYTLLEQRQLTLEEQEKGFEVIRSDHERLRRSYLQAKDDYNVLRRSGTITTETQNFDEKKELEGNLFRLGMRFDEVQEIVDKNIKEKPIHRQPFSSDNNRTADAAVKMAEGGVNKEKDIQKEISLSLDSADEMAFEQRVQEFRSEYNTCMDQYRKLKYTADTTEGEKELEKVIVKLNNICTEMPDMFRLSPEIQDRWEKLNKREQQARNQRNSPLPQFSKDGPVVARRRSETSELSDSDRPRAGFGGSTTRSSLGSILPDRMDLPSSNNRNMALPNSSSSQQPPNQHGRLQPHDNSRPSSRTRNHEGEDNSFSDRSFHNDDMHNANLPRPRRHAHGLKDPKHFELPHSRSFHDVNPGKDHDAIRGQADHHDSETQGAVGGARHWQAGEDTEGALAALPGPGKFKQMTKQRAADDADSGFIGSMVGSGVGEPPAVVQQQGERPLVLRHRQPTDESSTVTDESFDRSSHTSGSSRTKHKGDKRSKMHRHEHSSQSSQREDSYDGEEDTLENLGSEVSSKSSKQSKGSSNKRHRDKRKRDTTIDSQKSTDSEESTPRAEEPTRPGKHKEVSSSSQTSHQQQKPAPATKDTKTEIREDSHVMQNNLPPAPAATKLKQSPTETKHTSQKEKLSQQKMTSHHGSHSSLVTHHRNRNSSPARPHSRGSPTTDLLHTRSRRTSIESGRLSHRGADLVRSDLELKQDRAQIQKQSQADVQTQGISPGETLTPGNNQPPPLMLSHDFRHQDMVTRGKEFEERSVGSDVEVGSSITTRASSVNSNSRLKALQEEIEKLKEGFARANERSSHPPPPPPQIHHVPAPNLPSSERKQEPEYYDPFDDPYGFMRMPRRRANSFSGGRERDWDEWYWTLPQNRQYDGGDIPLGYAAADAYAEHPRIPGSRSRERNTRENVKNRLRQKRMEKKLLEDMPAKETEQAAASSEETGQHPTPVGAVASEEAAMYNYYLPSRFSTEAMRQQLASRGYFTTPSGGKIYSSTGEEADNEDDRGIVSDSGYRQRTVQQIPRRPWYQIKRPPQPKVNQTMGAVRAQSHNDIRTEPARYFDRASSPQHQQVRVTLQSCPLCGLVNYHTHPTYIHRGPPATTSIPIYPADTTLIDHSPIRMSRSRSRSVPRSRRYTMESRSRYRVREYNQLSNSSDDDIEEERTIKRSRSLSRGRSSSRIRTNHSRRQNESYSDSDDEDINLNRSLSLSENISRLTNKMMGTLSSELMRSSGRRDYSSSFW